MKMKRLPAQKNKPNSNPISSKAKMNKKSLAKKSGHILIFQKHSYALAGKLAIRKILGNIFIIPNYS